LSSYSAAVEKKLKILKFITWAMMVVAPPVYIVTALLLDPQQPMAPAGDALMIYMLLAIAIVQPLLAPLLARMEITKHKTHHPKGEASGELFLAISVIRMAMVEAVYIYGFVAYLLTGDIMNMLYFYPIGMVWSYFQWPTRQKYENLLEKLSQS
jgi:hypothetical protein